MKKLIFSLGVLAMTLTACTKDTDSKPTPELKIHFPNVVLNLDPHKMEDAYSMTVVVQLHRGLLRYLPSGDFSPDLAESWTESVDHLIYRVKIKDQKFSNGMPIDATHVQMSFARLFHIGAAIGADIDYIKGAKEFKKTGDLKKFGVKVISPKEVQFELSHPSALFLKHLAVADCAILPLKHFNDGIDFSSTTPFSGPYRVIKKSDDGSVTIQKWRSDVTESKNPPTEIIFFPSSRSSIDLAMAGETDTLDHDPVSAADLKSFQKNGWTETATEIFAESFVVMNPNKVSLKLRKYLFSLVDQKVAAQRLGKRFLPAYGAIPRGVGGEVSAEDISSLKDVGAKATGEIRLQYDTDDDLHESLYGYLKETWENGGIKVHLEPLKKKDLLKRLFKSDCDICIARKSLDYPDGYSILTYFKSGYDLNYFHINDTEIDRMVEESGLILDRNLRETRYKEIQKKILAKYTLLPLTFGSNGSGLWSKKVEMIPPHVVGIHMLPFEMIEMKRSHP